MKNFVITSGGNDLNHNLMGLFAFVNNMASSLWFNRFNKEEINFFYDIIGNSPYYDKNINFTENVWEYYFEPPSNIKYSELDENIDTKYGQWNSFNGGNNLVREFHLNPNLMNLKKGELKNISNFIFNGDKNKIKLRDEILNLIEQTKNKLGLNGTKYISVHYRSFTWEENKKYNPHQSRKINYENWFNEIDNLLTTEHKIFLATDDTEALKIFIERYGDRIIFNNEVERFSSDSSINHVGDNPFNIPDEYVWVYKTIALSTNRKQSPYECGLHAVVDCWLLSGGESIIKIFSGFSFFSTLINPEINIINIDTIY